MAAAASNPSQIIAVHEREWQTMTPTIKAKTLWSDPATQRRAQLTRFEPGASLPMHRHAGDELLYVIEGSIQDESGVVIAGNVGYRPNGCVHTVTTKNGATVLACITGGVVGASAGDSGPASRIIRLNEIAWIEALPGVRQKPIINDEAAHRRVSLARFEPGARLKPHRHNGDELVYVIEGSNADESGELVAGNLSYRPNGCTHSVWSVNGATAIAILTGGVTPV